MPQKISKETTKTRIAFLHVAMKQDNEVNGILIDLQNEIGKTIDAHTAVAGISDVDTVERRIEISIKNFCEYFTDIVGTANSKTAGIIAAHEFNEVMSKYGQTSLKPLPIREARDNQLMSNFVLKQFKNEAENYSVLYKLIALRRRNTIDGRNILQRIKLIQGGAIKTARNIIARGMEDGKSAKLIAAELQAYVMPTTNLKIAPWSVYRARFGRQMSFVPAGIASGSIAYNAFRIARTEINQTYREAAVALTKGKPWVKGWKWNLSHSHPVLDECDDYAGHGLYKTEDEIPHSHPNCFCFVTTEVMSPDEFAEFIKKGDNIIPEVGQVEQEFNAQAALADPTGERKRILEKVFGKSARVNFDMGVVNWMEVTDTVGARALKYAAAKLNNLPLPIVSENVKALADDFLSILSAEQKFNELYYKSLLAGQKLTVFRGLNGEAAQEIINQMKSGATQIRIPINSLSSFTASQEVALRFATDFHDTPYRLFFSYNADPDEVFLSYGTNDLLKKSAFNEKEIVIGLKGTHITIPTKDIRVIEGL